MFCTIIVGFHYLNTCGKHVLNSVLLKGIIAMTIRYCINVLTVEFHAKKFYAVEKNVKVLRNCFCIVLLRMIKEMFLQQKLNLNNKETSHFWLHITCCINCHLRLSIIQKINISEEKKKCFNKRNVEVCNIITNYNVFQSNEYFKSRIYKF